MHSLLENYLSEVNAHLGTLPPKRRADELREMRAHLENAMVVSREMGRPEAEAAASAVEQFGAARDLGENVVWAWRRGRTLDGRRFWGAAACAFVLTLFLPFLQDTPLENPMLGLFRSLGVGGQAGPPAQLMLLALAGGVCGLLFPKRAFGGIVLGVTAWHAFFLATVFTAVVLDKLDSPMPSSSVPEHVAAALLALLAAWAGSRWRNARAGQARRAEPLSEGHFS